MSVIYSEAWYQEMTELINGSEDLRKLAPADRVTLTLEVVGDGASPYLPADVTHHFLIVIEQGCVHDFRALEERHDGNGLDFRFIAPASVWEGIAAGQKDPITAGLRGEIKIRGDMRFLMTNADAVKLVVDLYASQVKTEWPDGKPPYGS